MRKTRVKPVKNRLDTGPHSEPPTGIDPVTSFLPRTRSTTELGGQRVNTLPDDFAGNKSAAGQGKAASTQFASAPECCTGKALKLGQAEYLARVDVIRIGHGIRVRRDQGIQVNAELHGDAA